MSSYDGNASSTWTFDTTGNLNLPLGSIVYETNIPDQSLSGSAIALKPIGGTTANQQLLIYPTANDGDHVHMTSGNLYATELFLGSDNFYVKLANTGNIVINSNNGNSSNAMWTFGTDGSLTLPIGVSIDYNGNVQYPKIIADSGKLFSVQGQGNSGSAALAWTIDPNAASQYAAVAVTRAGDNLAKVVLTAQANSGDSANAKIWTFNETGNLTLPNGGNLIVSGSIVSSGASPAPTLSGFSSVSAIQFTNGSSNVTVNANSNLWTFDSTGNLTIPGSSGGFIKTVANASIGVAAVDNGTNNPAQLLSMTNAGVATSIISAYATNATIQTNAAGAINTWQFDNAGNLTAPGTVSANNFTGNGGGLSNVATKVAGSWTLASGNNTVSISVPLNGTYALWVNGNIPNGIVTYTATAVVTNTNVPVLGEQYAWYYAVGNALVLTSIPDQFTGTVGSISNVNTYIGNTANVFTFGITNNSGNTAVVNYGYTKL
jgi:hypothetical protein